MEHPIVREHSAPPRPAKPARHHASRLIAFALVVATGALASATPAITEAHWLARARLAVAGLAWDVALADDAQAARLAPLDPAPLVAAATIYLWQGRVARAETTLAPATRRAPCAADLWLVAGTIRAALGDPSSARAAWQRALPCPPGAAAATAATDLAWSWLAGDDLSAVLALAQRPAPEPDLRAALALARWHLGQPGAWAALASIPTARLAPYRALAAAWRGGPQDEAALGYADLAAGLPALALAPLRVALAARPGYGPGHAYLGWALWSLGQRAAAEAAFTQAAALDPADPAAISGLATTRAASGDAKEALFLLKDFRAHHGDAPAILALEAAIARQCGDLGDEEDARWRLAAVAAPADRPTALRDLAAFYRRTGLGRDDGRAAWSVQAALAANPRDAATLDLAGQFALAAGDVATALRDWRAAVARDPRFAPAQADLGALLWRLGERDQARVALEHAINLAPDGVAGVQAALTLARG